MGRGLQIAILYYIILRILQEFGIRHGLLLIAVMIFVVVLDEYGGRDE